MVYVKYNLHLWVRQLQKTHDEESISLDNIDTTSTWRFETVRLTIESIPYWLGVDLEALETEEVVVERKGEPEVEEEEQPQGEEAE